MTAATAGGTNRFIQEFDDRAQEFLSESLSCPMANRTISVAVGITIMAGEGDHAAPPNSVGDFDPISGHRQAQDEPLPSRHYERNQEKVGPRKLKQ